MVLLYRELNYLPYLSTIRKCYETVDGWPGLTLALLRAITLKTSRVKCFWKTINLKAGDKWIVHKKKCIGINHIKWGYIGYGLWDLNQIDKIDNLPWKIMLIVVV